MPVPCPWPAARLPPERREDVIGARAARWTLVVIGVTVCLSIGLPLLGLRVFHASDILLVRPPWNQDQPPGFDPTNLLVSDTVDAVMPFRAEFRWRVQRGDYPLWSPYPSGGTPLGSVPHVGPISPLNLPYLLTPIWYAPAASKLLELVVAIGFTFLFLRLVGVSVPSALVGGLAYAFSGFQVVWTNWPQTQVGALIPALFWAAERGISRRDAASALALTVVAAVMFLEGFPAVTAWALLAAGAYAIVRVSTTRGLEVPRRLQTLSLLGGAVILGLGLTAVQILPFLEQLGIIDISYRVQTPADHLPLSALATLAIPNTFGSPVDRNYFGLRNYVEIQSFIGGAILVMVVAAVVWARRLRVVRGLPTFLQVGALLIAILIYVGGPPLAALQALPLFGINFVGRLRSVLGFFLACLAALGLEAVFASRPAEQGPRRLVAPGVWAAAGIIAAVGYARIWDLAGSFGQRGYLLRHSIIPVASVLLALATVAWARWGPRLPRLGLWLLPVLVAAEALAFALPFWPRIPKEQFYPITPAHRFLQEHLDGNSIVPAGALYGGTTTFYGLRSVTSHSFHDPAWAELLRAIDANVFIAKTNTSFRASPRVATSRILDRLSARYFVTPAGAPVFGNLIPGPEPAGEMSIDPSKPIAAPLPSGASGMALPQIRAVVVQVAGYPGNLQDKAFLRVDLIDATGRALATGRRRLNLRPHREPRPFQVAIGTRTLNRPTGNLRVRLSVEAPEGELRVLGDSERRPAISVIAGDDDGLRLVFADRAIVYERLSALPRIRWAGEVMVVEDPTRRLQLLAAGVPSDQVVLGAPGPRASSAEARLDVLEDSGDEVAVAITAGGPGYLVVADAMQHGWHAQVDGNPVPLHSADHALVAVFVPAGIHRVDLRYEPWPWRIGLLVSAFSLTVTLALLVVPGRRVIVAAWRKRSGTRRPSPGT